MRGLLYKEFALNRVNLLCFLMAAVATIAGVFFPFMSVEKTDTALVGKFMEMMAAFMYIIDFFVLNVFNVNFLQADEQKTPAYFFVSTPESVKGVIWAKYVFILLVAVFMMIWCFLLEDIVTTVTGIALNAKILYGMLFYMHLFFSAFDLPFMLRFGAKAGSVIKGVLFAAIVLGGIIYALFGDLSMFGSMDTFYEAMGGFISGEKIPDSFWLLIGLLPFVSIGAYFGSYKLSCKLYLKGVETYAK